MIDPKPSSLNAKILAAHERNDLSALAELYAKAAQQKRACGELDAAGFLLTQAYVYALDCGHHSAQDLRRQLVEEGREQEE